MRTSYMRVAVFSAALALTAPVFAQYIGPQKRVPLVTVTAAASLSNNTYVMLEGHIISRIRKEHYTFKDATGSIEIEIDDKHFPSSRPIDEKTKVRIHGKIDKDFIKDATIDVEQVEVL
ncbi:MAG TPA: NirD/YgiW/YdeI family stress tolerance protein [Herbaspirillum sp.]|nr:NirD/YgiW/YdeI family stress tolerance protein [Herbaspirillum sp.]